MQKCKKKEKENHINFYIGSLFLKSYVQSLATIIENSLDPRLKQINQEKPTRAFSKHTHNKIHYET